MSHGSAEHGADVIEDEAPAERVRTLELCPPARVMDIAPLVFEKVQKACDYSGGRWDPHIVLECCAGRRPAHVMQLWLFGSVGGGQPAEIDAIGVTQINEYMTGLRSLEMVLVGGAHSSEWMPFEEQLRQVAKANGCDRVEAYGRRGWGKKLPHWRATYTLFETDLTDGASGALAGDGETEGEAHG